VAAVAETPEDTAEPVADEPEVTPEETPEGGFSDDDAETAEVVAAVEASSDHTEDAPDNKDNTGVADPWGLPQAEAEPVKASSNGNRLLSKIGG
jgi:hypothetical protein